ncbi:AMP-binding protein [Stenotrophomonas sp. YAU14A_MKIMI4_1]|uniref:AMP-binding protein n=1 Tax=Stenotrophomonas sp. YAU14A_MKIMI4_1 TaxID=2072408 RepID=UPI000D53CE62|nr:AMP-binding protein [Stenotrophomonas sp. YAU14A_MKIMI4_1]AWH30862.1 AMP-binding protein [Stenotrophomonas sp. YAU14A_MKIMI4_1]
MAPDSTARPSYDQALADFDLAQWEARLQGDLQTGVNACVECCDRHCGRNATALRWVDAQGHLHTYTFEHLREAAARAANVLADAGTARGDVVAGLLPRTPDLLAVILGTWRLGAIYQPLFTAFGPKAIETRLATGRTALVVTDLANRSKLDGVGGCPTVATIASAGQRVADGDIDWRARTRQAPAERAPVMLRGDDLMALLSTSGTTGSPKGVPVPLRALLAFASYMELAVDLRADDVFWNIADPGWAYGLYYGVTGPLLLGHATTFSEAGFSVAGLNQIIQQLGVTNLAGSPTAYRQIIGAGPAASAGIKGQLRVVSSAGEPLNPEIARWFREHLGTTVLDHYGQTETGMVVNNHHALAHAVRPGSSGFAMPGYRVAVLDEHDNVLPPRTPGILAVDVQQSPILWFTGYYGTETPALRDGWYRTGDSVEWEDDGSISFIGRSDDLITSSGYRIGPFDVESVLMEHAAVAEAAVIGVPDPERTEIVKAFVILRDGHSGDEGLATELQQHVRSRLSAHAYPRQVEFVAQVPKTPSGKVQRFLLRKAEIEKQAARS